MNSCQFLNSPSPKKAVTETRNFVIKIFMPILWVSRSELLEDSGGSPLCGIPMRHTAQDISEFGCQRLYFYQSFIRELFYTIILYVLGVCMQVLQAVGKQKTEKCSDFPRCHGTGIPNNKKKEEGKCTIESEIPWQQTWLCSTWRIQGICICSVVKYWDRRIYIRGDWAAETSSHVLQKSLQCKM